MAVVIISGGNKVDFEEAIRLREQFMKRHEEYLEPYRERAEAIGLTAEELEYSAMQLGMTIDTYLAYLESFIRTTPKLLNPEDFVEFIEEEGGLSAAEIRKQLKYEKNPMRIKQLNKMLSGMRKERKKK